MDVKEKYISVINSLDQISSELFNSDNGLTEDEADDIGNRISSLIPYISDLMASDPRT